MSTPLTLDEQADRMSEFLEGLVEAFVDMMSSLELDQAKNRAKLRPFLRRRPEA